MSFPIDSLLFLSGCRIFIPKSFYSRVINTLLSIIMICVILSNLILLIIEWHSMKNFVLVLLSLIVFFSGSIYFIIKIILKRNKIQDNVIQVLKELPENKRKSFKRYSTFITLMGFNFNFGFVICCSIHLILWNSHDLFIGIRQAIIFSCSVFGSINNAMALFYSLLQLIKIWEEFYFEKLEKKIKLQFISKQLKSTSNSCNSSDTLSSIIKQMIRDRQRMSRIKNEMVNFFGIVIVSWFLYTFLIISGWIVFNQANTGKLNFIVYYVLFFVGEGSVCGCLMLMMVLVDDIKEFVRNQSRLMIELFYSNFDDENQSNINFILHYKITLKEFEKECNSFSFSPCGLFLFNKKLLLSFVTSIITFTALFVQIGNSISYYDNHVNRTELVN